MSNQQSSFTSSSSFSYSSSSSSSNVDGQQSGYRETRQMQSGPDGTTQSHTTQNLGEPAVTETRNYDGDGRQLLGGSGSDAGQRKIEDVSDEQQAKNDRLYEERMEDEYAKREGGA